MKPTTKYKGVTYKLGSNRSRDNGQRRWQGHLGHDGKNIDCGYYLTDKEAAIARDKMIIRLGSNKPLQVLKRLPSPPKEK